MAAGDRVAARDSLNTAKQLNPESARTNEMISQLPSADRIGLDPDDLIQRR